MKKTIAHTYDTHPRDKDFGLTVLIVDDEKKFRDGVKSLLNPLIEDETIRLIEASSIPEAKKALRENQVHVAILDKRLGPDSEKNIDENGIESIPSILEIQPHLQILMFTGSDSAQEVVRAMNLGALGFVSKGSDPELLIAQVNKALQISQRTLRDMRNEKMQQQKVQINLIGKSPATQELRLKALAVSKTEAPVLLTGPSGTGKTETAKFIHRNRQQYLKQADRPWISVNMAAIPEALAERELFGHEKGAFTDASEGRPGYIELANGGTLFLDEIGEASPDLQAKLLKVIEDGLYRRLGSSEERVSSFHLICATNRNLREDVKAGKFRADLLMRISTFTIEVPTLSERKEDLEQILENLLPRVCQKLKIYVPFTELPHDFKEYIADILNEGEIEGNIRGLEQLLATLLIRSPRDKNDTLVLNQWRTIPEFQKRKPNKSQFLKDGLSTDDLMNTPIFIGSNFPGLLKLLETITTKIVKDAELKFDTTREIGDLLKLPYSTAYGYLSKFGNKVNKSENLR